MHKKQPEALQNGTSDCLFLWKSNGMKPLETPKT